jgi:hypothetical protein
MLDRFWHGCGNCHNGEGCGLAAQAVQAGRTSPEARLPLALTATIVFLLPLALGIAGAYLAGRFTTDATVTRDLYQGGGLVVGFAVGVVIARLLLWLACRRQLHNLNRTAP